MIRGSGEENPEGRGHIGDEYVHHHRGNHKNTRDRHRRVVSEPESDHQDRIPIGFEIEVEIEE